MHVISPRHRLAVYLLSRPSPPPLHLVLSGLSDRSRVPTPRLIHGLVVIAQFVAWSFDRTVCCLVFLIALLLPGL